MPVLPKLHHWLRRSGSSTTLTMKIKKGDTVKILLGKDSGKTGVVDRVLAKKGKVVISGLNLYKRHVKKQGHPPAGGEGGVIEIVKPLNISNVALVCSGCKKTTRVGFKFEGSDKVRFCKKCGKGIKQ